MDLALKVGVGLGALGLGYMALSYLTAATVDEASSGGPLPEEVALERAATPMRRQSTPARNKEPSLIQQVFKHFSI
jgi:hypothetical protein